MFLFLFLISPFFILGLLKLASESFNKISLVNVSVFFLYFFSIIGTLPLYYKWEQYRVEMGIVDSDKVFLIFLLSNIAIIFFLLGVVFFQYFEKRYLRKIIPIKSIQDLVKIQFFGLLILFCMIIFVLFLFINQVEKIALIGAFQGDDAVYLRSQMVHGVEKYHRYSFFFHHMGVFITFVLFSSFLLNRKMSIFMMFIASFFITGFALIMNTEKAPFIFFLLGLFFTYFLTCKNGVFSIKNMLLFIVFGACFGMAFQKVFDGGGGVMNPLLFLFSRAFSGSIAPAYFYLEFFPEQQGFLYGKTLPNIGGIFDYEPYLYTIEVMNWVFPEHIEQGVIGSMPMVFWGEAYANFGFIGIPIVAFFIGLIVRIMQSIFSRLPPTPISIGFVAYFMLVLKDLSITGFSSFIFNFNVIGLFVLTFFLLLLKKY